MLRFKTKDPAPGRTGGSTVRVRGGYHPRHDRRRSPQAHPEHVPARGNVSLLRAGGEGTLDFLEAPQYPGWWIILAAVLYVSALGLRAPASWLDALSLGTGLHLVTYVATGVIVGGFASRARGLVRESLRVLDELLEFAHRDAGSGALRTRGLERVVAGRVARGLAIRAPGGRAQLRRR